MSGGNTNVIMAKLTARIFPVVPDFYRMIVDHCDLVCRAMDVFVEFMETGDQEKGDQVRAMEKEGDDLKSRQMETLSRAFATPLDREDIYRAIMAIDEILNYAKTTVRELEDLAIQPDQHMVEIVRLLRDGAYALKAGYAKLGTRPKEADTDAIAARKAERSVEKVYRAALVELFHVNSPFDALGQAGDAALNTILPGILNDYHLHVMAILKRREVYRHLSNTADRVENAGSILHDIIVQVA